MKFESCNHCGRPGAYVSYMFVECSNPLCDQYTFRQNSAYQAHLDELAARAMEKATQIPESQKADDRVDALPAAHWPPSLFFYNRNTP